MINSMPILAGFHQGNKIPKLKLGNELKAHIIKDIVIRCGGNSAKMPNLIYL